MLVPGGRFLVTAPTEVGVWRGLNTGSECGSPGRTRYEEILEQSGVRLLAMYEDGGENNHYEAEKLS